MNAEHGAPDICTEPTESGAIRGNKYVPGYNQQVCAPVQFTFQVGFALPLRPARLRALPSQRKCISGFPGGATISEDISFSAAWPPSVARHVAASVLPSWTNARGSLTVAARSSTILKSGSKIRPSAPRAWGSKAVGYASRPCGRWNRYFREGLPYHG